MMEPHPNSKQVKLSGPMSLPFLSLDSAMEFYRKWDCQIETKQHSGVYYKCLSGNGTVELINGNSYVGHFTDGLMHGKGKFTWADGLVYSGQFHQNSITGRGVMAGADGSVYEGDVRDGQRHGQGKYTCKADESVYVGGWNKDKKHGLGIITFPNGTYFEGQFKNGQREGRGKMHYKNGNEYEGLWINNKKNGFGVMNWHNASERYVGNWEDDQPNGNGTYYWFDNKIEFKILKNIYTGQWHQGCRDGVGAIFYGQGCRFQGYFKRNCKEGFGLTTDMYGFRTLDIFKGNRPIHEVGQQKPQKEIQVETQRPHRQSLMPSHGSKLPELKNKKDVKLPSLSITSKNASHAQDEQSSDNIYRHMVDFHHPELNHQLYNFLLRANSSLRNLYKQLGTGSTVSRQYYTGVTLQNLWRALCELKLLDEGLSLAEIDRWFHRGVRAAFTIEPPSEQYLKLIEAQPHYLNTSNSQWSAYLYALLGSKLDWDKMTVKKAPNRPQIGSCDIHEPSKIILFRHFICYLVRVATARKRNLTELSLRQKLEEIIQMMIAYDWTAKPIKQKANASIKSVQQWSSHRYDKSMSCDQLTTENLKLFELVNYNRPHSRLYRDMTCSVRTILYLLDKVSYFKDIAERGLFLDRVQKMLPFKLTSPQKRELRGSHPTGMTHQMEAIVLSYELTFRQFDELLTLLLVRKACQQLSLPLKHWDSTKPSPEVVRRYGELIQVFLACMKHTIAQDRHKTKYKQYYPKTYRRPSNKDKERIDLLRRYQYEQQMRRQKERLNMQLAREAQERIQMSREDRDTQDNNLDEASESNDYFD